MDCVGCRFLSPVQTRSREFYGVNPGRLGPKVFNGGAGSPEGAPQPPFTFVAEDDRVQSPSWT